MDKTSFNNLFEQIKPVQVPEELYWLVNKVEQLHPKMILEIGTEFGGTFKFWEQLIHPDGILIGIDLNHRFVWDINQSTKNIYLITGDSTKPKTYGEFLKVLSTIKQNFIDFIFIDGGHDESTVTNDFNIYKKHLSKGGMIAFHDINDLIGVKQFWDKQNYQRKKESITADKNGIGIGILHL